MTALSYEKIELVGNAMLRDIYDHIDTALTAIDQRFYDEDVRMQEVFGEHYGYAPTPRPARYATGELPTVELLDVSEYPYLSVWITEVTPWSDHAGWADVRLHILIQAFTLARDHTYLSRQSYRYGTAFQNIAEENNLGGLIQPLSNAGRLRIGLSWKREFTGSGSHETWFVQPVIYEFDAEFIVD